MKKNPYIHTIHIGRREVNLIKGLALKKYLPEAIMDNVHIALKDQGLKWTDELIEECSMIISGSGNVTVMYKYDPLYFNGLLLFAYSEDPALGHRFGFAIKGKHSEYYMGTKFY